MYSRYALIQNTINFIQEKLDARRMNRGCGDEALLRMAYNLVDLMAEPPDSKHIIRMVEFGIEFCRYKSALMNGVLVYTIGMEDPRLNGNYYDADSVKVIQNMMGVK